MSAESPQLLVIIGDSMVTEDRAVSRVESVYRVYAGPGGGHAMWGWAGVAIDQISVSMSPPLHPGPRCVCCAAEKLAQ